MVFSDLFFLYVFLPSFALLYLLGTSSSTLGESPFTFS